MEPATPGKKACLPHSEFCKVGFNPESYFKCTEETVDEMGCMAHFILEQFPFPMLHYNLQLKQVDGR